MERARHLNTVKRAYVAITPNSIGGAILALAHIAVLLLWFSMFSLGVVEGATIAVNGGRLSAVIADLWAIESEVWAESTTGGPAARVVIGIFWWMVAIGIAAAVAGVHVGYFAPIIATAVSTLDWGLFLPFVVASIAQIIRIFEIGAGREIVDRGGTS